MLEKVLFQSNEVNIRVCTSRKKVVFSLLLIKIIGKLDRNIDWLSIDTWSAKSKSNWNEFLNLLVIIILQNILFFLISHDWRIRCNICNEMITSPYILPTIEISYIISVLSDITKQSIKWNGGFSCRSTNESSPVNILFGICIWKKNSCTWDEEKPLAGGT